ncbi:contractile injection system tape measure protein [Spirosoma radiotolerans]|uniref:Uncharacterized protein n=1 Tax=Spirosoma radiotolerans TaxID=1379870 RepID=A0A0E3ZW80_9BACT|nr:contractile injection system tape measure protein [Spirosoma radiotolerans]AKD55540.1 hypothetical protein SD10_12165 [Spirosoma radiotolerans]
MQTHLVNSLQFEMTCPSDEQAMRVGAEVGRTLQPLLVSAIDRICSRYISEDQWLRLDKLVVQLPVFVTDFPDENLFATAFEHHFEAAFVKQLALSTATTGAVSRQKTDLDTLIHFLLTGQLPWWAIAETTKLDTILNELIHQQPETLRSELLRIIRAPQVVQRLIYQFTTEVAADLIGRCFPELQTWVHAEPIEASLLKQEPLPAEVYLRLMPYVTHQPTLVSQTGAIIEQVLNRPLQRPTVHQLSKTQLTDYKAVSKDNAVSQVAFEPTEAPFLQSATDSAVGDRPKYFVKNAGIILLSPFLSPFFREVGWIENGEFIDDLSREKALHSLHYLATGETHASEYLLTLGKLLCGIPLKVPVPRKIDLTEAGYREAYALLTDVISHWQALKSTSVNGLREGFLQRDGVLTFTNSAWELQVERQTIDVLLDSIPWSFSLIKLPWMPSLLYTQW